MLASSAWGATDNGGLGLLPIGDLYPPKLKFLEFQPDQVLALPESKLDVSYQVSYASVIVNTQSAPQNGSPQIAQAQVDAGLTPANFPSQGFGAYMQMGLVRQLIRIRYGLGDGLEAGLDQAWVSFQGDSLDPFIENAESLFNGRNPERFGATQGQFHYYLIHNGRFLAATSSPTGNVPQDPVFSMKWNLTGGGEVMPAVSLKLAYKAPLDSATSPERSLVSSGHDDTGYSVMIAKAIGRVVAHVQLGESELSGTGSDYVSSQSHKFLGLEYRFDSHHSALFQTSSETTVFKAGSVSPTSADFQITRPADMLTFGYKYSGETFHMDLGWSEDYNSRDNTSDTVLFVDFGWRW